MKKLLYLIFFYFLFNINLCILKDCVFTHAFSAYYSRYHAWICIVDGNVATSILTCKWGGEGIHRLSRIRLYLDSKNPYFNQETPIWTTIPTRFTIPLLVLRYHSLSTHFLPISCNGLRRFLLCYCGFCHLSWLFFCVGNYYLVGCNMCLIRYSLLYSWLGQLNRYNKI